MLKNKLTLALFRSTAFYRVLGMLLAGGSLVFAFSPFNLSYFAFPAIGYLFYTAYFYPRPPLSAFFYSFTFSAPYFTLGVSWIYIALKQFTAMPVVLVFLCTAFFILLLSVFPSTAFYCFVYLKRRFPFFLKLYVAIPCFAILWIFAETLRSHFFSGFPWLLLAYTQTNTVLSGFIPIVGEKGGGFLVCCMGSIFIFLLRNLFQLVFDYTRRQGEKSVENLNANRELSGLYIFSFADRKKYLRQTVIFLLLLGIAFFGGSVLQTINWTDEIGEPLSVALIQGNIAPTLKWDPREFKQIVESYVQLSRVAKKSTVFIWPESAIPVPQEWVAMALKHWDAVLKQKGKTLLLGIPSTANEETYYNTLLAIGQSHGIYKKEHLVPFGEYAIFPRLMHAFANYFNIPMSDFQPGSTAQALIRLEKMDLATFICYEIAYENLVLKDFPQANLLLVVSDDSWFGHSIAAWQQLQIGQFRCIETGRQGLFVGNNGITAWVDQKGKIKKYIPPYQADFLQTKVRFYAGSTPMVYLWANFNRRMTEKIPTS